MIPLQVLTPEEVEVIHQATLHLLAETGIVLREPHSCQLLLAAGATRQGDRILLPPELVESCLAVAGRRPILIGRNGYSKTLGDGQLYFHNLGGAREVFDHHTGQRRRALLEDVRQAARLLDSLSHCSTITPFFTPTEVPGAVMSLAMYRHTLPHTTKPVQGPGVQTAAEVRFAVEMAAVIGPPSQTLSLSVSPVSPLTFPDDAAAAILEIARQGVAFAPLPCPTAGTTAPLSLAGALMQQNAEVLAAIVLAQLVRPGLPIIYCGRLAMMEPRTGLSVWGGVELGLASAGTVALGHRYGLPVNVYGFSTNSHTLDVQCGAERSLNAALPMLAGADELSGIGEMEAGVMGSLAQMVVDDELAAGLLRLRQGLLCNEQTLAQEVIAGVMRGSRNFLAQKHTRQTLRSGELCLTDLAERGSWEAWEQSGRQGMAERAQAEAERRLREHLVPPLEPQQEAELDRLLQSALEELLIVEK